MDNRLLDSQVLGEVIMASPRIGHTPEELGYAIVEKLETISGDSKFCETITDGQASRYYRTTVADLTRWLSLYPRPDIHEVGRICVALGLRKIHRNDGRWVAWNDRQVELLKNALGGG